MKVIVLGGGVVGVTSAWYLARAGHEVVVIDRQPAAGMETSFANAGQVSPGYSAPWAAPGIPIKALRWLAMRHRPLVVWPSADGRFLSWLARLLANCTEAAYRVNKGRMVRLAEYSRDVLRALRAETGIEYDHRERGTLQLFRTQKQLDHVGDDTAVLDQYGVSYEVLDPAGCAAVEPALGIVRDKIVGGLRLPGDETGDAHLFTQRLAAMAEAAGVTFRYGTQVVDLPIEGGRVRELLVRPVPTTIAGITAASQADTPPAPIERITGDVYLVAMGSFSPILLRRLGVYLPVYPVKGYSITVPVTDAEMAPQSTVMDESFKVAITRLGSRIRVGGTAELAGYSTRLRAPRRATLEHSLGDLFPRGGDMTAATFWTGLRPMTPDGTPIVGPTRYPNLFVNTGHGTLGWTMACGSGRVIADLLSARSPDIDASDLGVERYRKVA